MGAATTREGIATGRAWLDEIMSGRVAGTDAIAERTGCSERAVRQTLSLAFLSPTIVQAAIAGTLPRGAGVSRLADLPPNLAAQWRTVGAAEAVATSGCVRGRPAYQARASPPFSDHRSPVMFFGQGEHPGGVSERTVRHPEPAACRQGTTLTTAKFERTTFIS